ncbi:SDR family NAD(P)-dependent oxidoreductase [Aromatoleum petrolei]|uniref:Glucose 1-dehydrogenase n=1 Tax=Aromatoleum petrolei TaxID=76116 RepID=A0ABX1MKV2_9RHOO|nr:glucose 1-dehydrogenase [Aromatoleum petrolei]NMF88610.1 glucose 1-dehydrogenase [Aromatoleum petrolei]QTQ34681.1 Short-chain dehydrogenase/reductase [Aromatoleum petrolei]
MTAAAKLFDLTGKVALITGGSRGLGRAMSLAFAAAGADVVVTSRNLESCQAVCAEIEGMGRQALPYACHAGHWDELEGLVEAAYARFGKVDILVNNAGKSPLFPGLSDVTEAMWESVFSVNLKGPFRLSVLVGNRMKQGAGGSIINISSIGSERPEPFIAPYSAAKVGLNAITKALALDLGPKVRVNCILPGGFLTDIAKAWDMDKLNEAAKTFALQRFGQPDEIVGTALYFASDASSFTTGALLRVDGGVLP